MRSALTVVVLLALLAASTAVAIWVWLEIGEVAISSHGLAALGLGAVLTFGLGAGLMTLVFVSNRRGFDHRAHQPHGSPQRPDGDQADGRDPAPPA
jgi:hypothetical protein